MFERIAPSALEQCFQKWVEQIVSTAGAQVIPIDGKTVKGSYDRNKQQSSLHLVSAWASEQRILLGQVKVERKTNEIKATIVMVKRVRRLWNKTTRETMFYLSSLPCDAQRIGRAIRVHWGIENQLHWVLMSPLARMLLVFARLIHLRTWRC